MMTLTLREHDKNVQDAKKEMSLEGKRSLRKLKSGADISEEKHLRNLNSLLYALEYYRTGAFQPEEYFNVHAPDEQMKTSSNTIQNYYYGKDTRCEKE